MATFTFEASCQQQTALLELPGLADVFVRNVTIITIIYFAEYQVVQREAKSSSIVHVVHYIMLAPHMPFSLLLALEIITERHVPLKERTQSQVNITCRSKLCRLRGKKWKYFSQLCYLLYGNIKCLILQQVMSKHFAYIVF